MNFSPSTYYRLKLRLTKRYNIRLKESLHSLEYYPSGISTWMSHHYEELAEFSEIKWNFLNQINLFLFFQKQSLALSDHLFGEVEEEVFEKWNNSEFADFFLKSLNNGNKITKASHKTLQIFDRHLVTFAQRHILKVNKVSPYYRVQTSLGEITRNKKIFKLIENNIQINDKKFILFSNSVREGKIFSQRVIRALNIIEESSPESWERFRAFTGVIVPIKQSHFVSYSHQDLPGYSMINLYHRDFVDLMDDLLHENGHHHLNYYLNLNKLIEEPIDNIYYSPWRKTLRPLRGIYHAYFTFFWAFKLFTDLAKLNQKSDHSYFTSREKEKILWRAIEEYHMLNYTFNDLKWSHERGLIHRKGWDLIQEQQYLLKQEERRVKNFEKKLNFHKKDLKNLKLTLKQAEKDFNKNY